MRPAGLASPVVIDPLMRFGRPVVAGVATERLWELFDAGESIEEIAAGYDLAGEDVRAAVAYEEQFRSLAASRPVPARFFVDENDPALGQALTAASDQFSNLNVKSRLSYNIQITELTVKSSCDISTASR